jgi:hypothetical protein
MTPATDLGSVFVDDDLAAIDMQVAMHIVDQTGPNCQPALHAWFNDCYSISDVGRQALVDRAIATRAEYVRSGLEELGLKARRSGISNFTRGSWRLKCIGTDHFQLSGIRTPDNYYISCCLGLRDLRNAQSIWDRVSVAYVHGRDHVPHETEWYRIWFGYENWKTEQSGSPFLKALKATEISSVERYRSTGLLFDLLAAGLESEASHATV